jgi:hypothetical protein
VTRRPHVLSFGAVELTQYARPCAAAGEPPGYVGMEGKNDGSGAIQGGLNQLEYELDPLSEVLVRWWIARQMVASIVLGGGDVGNPKGTFREMQCPLALYEWLRCVF